ncbi:3410_t:CDS:2 [Funneliformis geosporum]|uniref:5869_t:CDS:1 n=1 Tax=Funneliformis geosporum TaxID=1117311 RepID=A0A9W4SN41_9GLOM|nr:3410_t:CDS:2 [Funneliformis geosporum]CAI2175470.1 5869_t:CDS:2 [Funneliformis geosporum]
MDELIAGAALTTVTFVGKAAFSHSMNYVLRQVTTSMTNNVASRVTKYMRKEASSSTSREEESKVISSIVANEDELKRAKESLGLSIRMILPAIDLIEIISARGNTTLQSTVEHAKQLQKEILSVGKKLDPNLNKVSEGLSVQQITSNNEILIKEIELLIQKIERFVPYLNLIMTTSGANLNWSLPNSVSPSRFLQSSNLLSETNRKFSINKDKQMRVGSTLKLKLYYMFTASVRPKSVKDFTWKEEFTKCDASLNRVREVEGKKKKKNKEFIYELVLIEDLNDGRYHEEFDEGDFKKQKVTRAKLGKPNESIPGKVLRIPVSDISRLYYTSSGSLLNIEESRSPVLVLKVIKGLSKTRMIKEKAVNEKDTDSNPLYVPPIAVTPEKRKKESNSDEEDKEEGIEDLKEVTSLKYPDTPSPRKIPLPLTPNESAYPPTPTPRRVPLPLTPTPSESEYLSTPSPKSVPLPSSPVDSKSTTRRKILIPDDEEDSTISDESEGEAKKENVKLEIFDNNVTGTIIPERSDNESLATKSSDIPENKETESDEDIQSSINTLSLLEFLLRLSALEVSEQKSHLEVTDEKLNLFLRDEDSSGASLGSQTPESTPSKSTSRTSGPRSTPVKSSSLSSTRRLLFKDDIRLKDDFMDSPLTNKMSNLKLNE